jgi:acetyl esterase/lipase
MLAAVLAISACTTQTTPEAPSDRIESAHETTPSSTPPDTTLLRNIPYVENGTTVQVYDVYRPVSDAPAPVVVWVHGGAWSAGSKTDVPILDLLDDGIAIVSIGYRLAPADTYPAPVQDIEAAINHIVETGPARGLDPDRIVLSGHSSGAHLALLAAMTTDLPLRGVFAAGIWSDLRITDAGYWSASVLSFGAIKRTVAQFVGCDPDDCPEAGAVSLPLLEWDHPVPVLLQHGLDDGLIPPDETITLHEALIDKGMQSTLSLLPSVGHDVVVDETVRRFLRRELAL